MAGKGTEVYWRMTSGTGESLKGPGKTLMVKLLWQGRQGWLVGDWLSQDLCKLHCVRLRQVSSSRPVASPWCGSRDELESLTVAFVPPFLLFGVASQSLSCPRTLPPAPCIMLEAFAKIPGDSWSSFSDLKVCKNEPPSVLLLETSCLSEIKRAFN